MSQDLRTRPTGDEAPPAEERRPRLPPVAYPVLGLLFGAVMVWAFSRILLSLSEQEVEIAGLTVGGKEVAAFIALLMALNILVASALVAYGRRVRHRPTSFPLLLAAGVLVVAGGVASLTIAEEAEEAGGAEGGEVQAIQLVARDIAFDKEEIRAAAGSDVRIEFNNQDANIPHNVAIYTDESATEPVFEGEIFNGVATETYTFEAPAAGQYFFRCDVHPNEMTGTFVVAGAGEQEGEGPGAGEGGPGGGEAMGGATAQISARNISFDRSQLSLAAETEVTIRFANNDRDIPHNVSIYESEEASNAVFEGEIFPGPDTVEYTFQAPPPGDYFFRCDVHPTEMTGTITFG